MAQTKIAKRISTIVKDDIFQTSLWIGVSAAVMAVVAFLSEKPELANYYGLLNLVAYVVKSINDRRK